VLGGETSAEVESFSDGKTLEYPQYTPLKSAAKPIPDWSILIDIIGSP
jgi:tRNA G37 N-methylase TrmD